MCKALQLIRQEIPQPVVCGIHPTTRIVHVIFDEFVDGGVWFRLEVQSLQDASRAICFVRFNGWSTDRTDFTAGTRYLDGHVAPTSGFICLGDQHLNESIEDSPYPLLYVLQRAKYWCIAFSYMKEHNVSFPNI
jgi:hypothetical protein